MMLASPRSGKKEKGKAPTTRKLEEEISWLRGKVAQLNYLIEVSIKINSISDLKELLRSVMDLGTTVLKVETSSLWLVDDETQELYIEITTGEGEAGEEEEEYQAYRIKMGEGLAGTVAQNRKPLIIQDASNPSSPSILCLPLTVVNPKDVLLDSNQPAERIVGVLQFLQKKGERFSPEDMDIFNAFSNLVAVAVHNRRLNEGLQEAFSTVKTLAEAIESKDHYTYGHSKRVTEFALAIFDELAGVPEDRKALEIAALLHDVGKVGIRPELLQKEGQLTEEEYEHVRSHPEISYHILKKTRHFRKILPAIRHHHERFDGRGFPDGLRGDDINLAAKIISVADAFDAMTSDRPYRQAMSQEDAAAELRRGSGTQFDPRIVEAFLLAREKGKIQPTIGKWSDDANHAARHTGGI